MDMVSFLDMISTSFFHNVYTNDAWMKSSKFEKHTSWSENQMTSTRLPEMVWWWIKLVWTSLKLVGSLLFFESHKDFGVGSSKSKMASNVAFDADS